MEESKEENFKAKVTKCFHLKAVQFAHFAYNKNTKEFFGRSCKSWGNNLLAFYTLSSKLDIAIKTYTMLSPLLSAVQILLFYLALYSALGGFFVIHMVAFVGLTPQPGENIKPWNFGRYAYSNFPNAKIGGSNGSAS